MKTTFYLNDKVIYVHEHLRGLAFDDAVNINKRTIIENSDEMNNLCAITESKKRKVKITKDIVEVLK